MSFGQITDEEFIRDLNVYWTDEEKTQYQNFPMEWLRELYAGTDFIKYGPGCRDVENFVTQLGDVKSSSYQLLLVEIEKYFLPVEKRMYSPPKVRLPEGNFKQRAHQALRNNNYGHMYLKYALLDSVASSNLLEIGNGLILEPIIQAIQLRHLLVGKNASTYAVSNLNFSDYNSVTEDIRNLGFVLSRNDHPQYGIIYAEAYGDEVTSNV